MDFLIDIENVTSSVGGGDHESTVAPQTQEETALTTHLVTTASTSTSPSASAIVICSLLLCVVVVTIVGNLVVLLAPIVERKLRNSLTYLIMNLAITDLLVAVMAMSFYTFDILLGRRSLSSHFPLLYVVLFACYVIKFIHVILLSKLRHYIREFLSKRYMYFTCHKQFRAQLNALQVPT